MMIEIVLLSCIVVVLQYLPKLLSAATSSIHMISFSSVNKLKCTHSMHGFRDSVAALVHSNYTTYRKPYLRGRRVYYFV